MTGNLNYSKFLLALMLSLTTIISVKGQKIAAQSNKYSRSSITPIYIRHSDSRLSIFDHIDSAKVSDKYDQNFIGENSMEVNFKMISENRIKYYELMDQSKNSKNLSKEDLTSLNSKISEISKQMSFEDSLRSFQIVAKLRLTKIPNRLLANLLIDNKLGYMTLAKLEDRALYDATDSDVMQAKSSERNMSSIKDRAAEMLNNVYFWVYDTNEYKISSDEKNSSLKTHYLRGSVYLIKLDMDLLNKNGQFDNLIFQEFNTTKLKAFREFNFPVKVIMRKEFSSSASNYTIDYSGSVSNALTNLSKEKSTPAEVKYIFKEDNQIQKELVDGTIYSANDVFTTDYEPFRVKASVFASNPISVKIGMKEDLEIDHLFKVSEYRLDKMGNPFEKNVGWIRVKKVANNKKKADGKMEPSTFYKVFSKGVDKGMKVQYYKETGLVWGLSYNALPDNIFSGPMLNIDYITNISPGLRVGLNVGGFTELKSPTWNISELTGVYGSGLSFKGRNLIVEATSQKIIQLNLIEITPYVGAYYSTTRMTSITIGNEELSALKYPDIVKLAYNEIGGLAGLKFGINFGKYTQLNFGYKLGFTFSSELKNDNEKEGTKIIGSLYGIPSNLSVGLRLIGF
jgi:hypothetical protein